MGGTLDYYPGMGDNGSATDNLTLAWETINMSTLSSRGGGDWGQNGTSLGSSTEGWLGAVVTTDTDQTSPSPAWLTTALATMWSTTTTTTTTTSTPIWSRPSHPSSPTTQQTTTAPSLAGPDLSPLGFLAIILVTVIGNSVMCLAIRLDKRLHHMTYYFFQSMGCMHLLMAALVMPPAILVSLQGSFIWTEELCKLWVTLDLFFCNNTCLHLAFTNMDTFLRLKDPLRHGRVVTTCSVVLWIGAPWMISFVQGIAQFMLSQGDHGIIHQGICFIADKNFVILGTLFSFMIPTVISILFYSLCVYEIRALKDGKFLDESDTSANNVYRYASNESIPEDASDTTSCVSETETLPREQVQLAVVTNITEHKVKSSAPASPNHSTEETTTFCDEPVNVAVIDQNGQTAFAEHILLSHDQSASCTLLLRDTSTGDMTEQLVRPNAEDDHDSPDETLRQEQAISRLMFLLLVSCISLWVPFSAGNIVYGVCHTCRSNMRFHQIVTFKWLAYSSAMLGPFIYAKFSEPMRQAYWKLASCHYCCQR